MNKHSYQARELQRVDWAHLGEAVRGQRLIFGMDVAKTNQYRGVAEVGLAVFAGIE